MCSVRKPALRTALGESRRDSLLKAKQLSEWVSRPFVLWSPTSILRLLGTVKFVKGAQAPA